MVFANAGIPLIGALIALGWLTIVPVVLLEALIAKILLRWSFRCALKWVTLANGLTTLLGIPVVWFLTAIVSGLTGGMGWGDGSIAGVLRSPAWFGPGYTRDLGWAMPLALAVLQVPCFLMSWWVEFAFLRRVAPDPGPDSRHSLWEYAWKANFASYSLLAILLLWLLASEI